MYCKHCGKEIAEDSKFCNFCGKETGVTSIFSKIKKPKVGVKTYLYILWFCIHFCMYLFGGQGYIKYREWARDDVYYASDYLYPDGPFRIYWGANYYDITDLIFYVVVVPLVLFTLYKLYRIWKR